MQRLLQINSSVFSSQGVSSQLADGFVARWAERNPQAQVIRRDLAARPVPHLDGERLSAVMTPAEQRAPGQRQAAEEAEQLIGELQAADVLVLGVPMYNFSVPSQLKAWFDHVARAGVTFRYTAEGPEGLLKGKKAYVFTTRGGQHRDSGQDGVVAFVRTMLGFMGITDVEFVYAEGLNMGEAPRRQGLEEAEARIEALLAA